MADISKCNSNTCPLRMACYRFTAPVNEHRQSYTTFNYNPITKECRGFYQDLKAQQLADMFSAKLIDNTKQ